MLIVAALSFLMLTAYSFYAVLSKWSRYDRFTNMINLVIIFGTLCGLIATITIRLTPDGSGSGVGSAMLYTHSVFQTLVFDILMFRNVAIAEKKEDPESNVSKKYTYTISGFSLVYLALQSVLIGSLVAV